MRKWGWLILCSGLTACTLGPDYHRPRFDLPTQWDSSKVPPMEAQAQWADWWTRYKDPTLDALIQRALDNNLDVRLQAARIRQARAQLSLNRAELFPTLQLQAQATRQRTSATSYPPGFGGVIYNNLSVAGALSYEVDLWGRLSRNREAAEDLLLQSAFARDAIRLSIITEVVTTYFNLRATQQQIDITESTIKSREAAFNFEETRYRLGSTDALTLRQAEADLQTTRAQLPPLHQQEQSLQSALAVLTGANPREVMTAMVAPGALDDLNLPTTFPQVLPSALLDRRPDIRAAEAALAAANANIGAAKAAWFPTLNLSALGGTQALQGGDLFTSPANVWSLGSSVVAPLLDFGRTAAQVETARALREQADVQYQTTVQTAFRDVRDALTLLQTSNESLQATQRQVQALQATLDLAEKRYQAGYISHLDLLDAQRNLFTAQLSLSNAALNRLNATATLFKALGGGWSEQGSPTLTAEHS